MLTGHTGFKGSWLSLWLQDLGAKVSGYSIDVPTKPSLYDTAAVGEGMNSETGDVRDLARLKSLQSRPIRKSSSIWLRSHSYAARIRILSIRTAPTSWGP